MKSGSKLPRSAPPCQPARWSIESVHQQVVKDPDRQLLLRSIHQLSPCRSPGGQRLVEHRASRWIAPLRCRPRERLNGLEANRRSGRAGRAEIEHVCAGRPAWPDRFLERHALRRRERVDVAADVEQVGAPVTAENPKLPGSSHYLMVVATRRRNVAWYAGGAGVGRRCRRPAGTEVQILVDGGVAVIDGSGRCWNMPDRTDSWSENDLERHRRDQLINRARATRPGMPL